MKREVIKQRTIQVMDSKENLINIKQSLVRKTVYKLYRSDKDNGKVCILTDEFEREILDKKVADQEELISKVDNGIYEKTGWVVARYALGHLWVEEEEITKWE